MVRLFFSFLLACTPFFASSQDSLVCIPSEAARYYLEAEEERWVLRERDSLSTIKIFTQGEEILVRDQKIKTFETDATKYAEREATLLEKFRLSKEGSDKLERRLVRQRNMAIGGGAGALIGSVIPGVGTLAGAMIGTGVGWVSSIFRKR